MPYLFHNVSDVTVINNSEENVIVYGSFNCCSKSDHISVKSGKVSSLCVGHNNFSHFLPSLSVDVTYKNSQKTITHNFGHPIGPVIIKDNLVYMRDDASRDLIKIRDDIVRLKKWIFNGIYDGINYLLSWIW